VFDAEKICIRFAGSLSETHFPELELSWCSIPASVIHLRHSQLSASALATASQPSKFFATHCKLSNQALVLLFLHRFDVHTPDLAPKGRAARRCSRSIKAQVRSVSGIYICKWYQRNSNCNPLAPSCANRIFGTNIIKCQKIAPCLHPTLMKVSAPCARVCTCSFITDPLLEIAR
jgi:hypothetical protein